jgi:hypothetical protein
LDTGTNDVTCCMPGTLIATPGGPRAVEQLGAVEQLAIGDLVLTADGAAERVRWMNRRAG